MQRRWSRICNRYVTPISLHTGFFADEQFRSVMQIASMPSNISGANAKAKAQPCRPLGSGLRRGQRDRRERPADRGILTAEGIIGLDLRKLELAVLSACDTGVAELGVGGGEGVYGLRRRLSRRRLSQRDRVAVEGQASNGGVDGVVLSQSVG